MSMNDGVREANAQWERVRKHLRQEFGDAVFKSWLQPLSLASAGNGEVVLGVPTRFMRDWVERQYMDRIRALWNAENPSIRTVSTQVEHKTPVERGKAKGTPELTSAGKAGDKPADANGHAAISAPLDPRFTFDNFIIGKSNEFAYAAAHRVAESATVPFNPMFLYGGVGLGKTHLMHAIAWHIRKTTPDRTVIYLSAEKFMYRFIRALREKNTVDFKDQFRSIDVLMIDDVQFIGGKDSTQEEFFHTFNALVDQGRQIVISSDKSPSDLEGMEERLISRLNCGLVADIHATTYELRLGCRFARHHLRIAPRHPSVQGRENRHPGAGQGDGVPRP